MGKPRKHKRKGPKNTRSGCLLCKPHKQNGCKHQRPHSEKKRIIFEDEVLLAQPKSYQKVVDMLIKDRYT